MAPRKTDFVIRFGDGVLRSYFGQLTPIGPRFGAKLKDTPRYPSEAAAQDMLAKFPITAAIMCEIRPVLGQKPRASRG